MIGDRKRREEGHGARIGAVDHLGLASTLLFHANVALAQGCHILGLACCLLKNTQTLQPIWKALKASWDDKGISSSPSSRQYIENMQKHKKKKKKSLSLIRCKEFAKSADKEITRESAGVSPSEKAYLFSSFPYLLLSRWARHAQRGGGGRALVVRPRSPTHQVLQTGNGRRSLPVLIGSGLRGTETQWLPSANVSIALPELVPVRSVEQMKEFREGGARHLTSPFFTCWSQHAEIMGLGNFLQAKGPQACHIALTLHIATQSPTPQGNINFLLRIS